MSCEIVAELGINHDGDRESAARLAREAQQAGASAVKLQLFDAAKLCALRADLSGLNALTATQLSVSDLEFVRDRVRIPVYASVFNTELLDCYAAAGFSRIKIAAREFEAQPELVQTIGADTRFDRVEASVSPELLGTEGLVARLKWLDAQERSVFALLCIPKYPADQPDSWKLAQLDEIWLGMPYRRHLGLSAHFSDFGKPMDVVVPVAIALGIELLEVHFSGSLGGYAREGKWSLHSGLLRQLVDLVHRSVEVLG